jgi:hypothetical protein
MSVKYVFFTFLLLFIVALLGVKNYKVLTQPIEVAVENELKTKQRKTSESTPITMENQRAKNSIASSIFISEKNIFSPERKDFPILPVEQNKTNVQSKVRPQVILYGVTIGEDYQAASITQPGRPLRKGERETLTIKIGEKIGEYRLSKITPDRITLEDTNDSFEVLLYDSKIPKKRTSGQTETKPTTVMSPTLSPRIGPTEVSKPVPPEEIQEETTQGKTPLPPASTPSTPPVPEKTFPPSSPRSTPAPLPPPTRTPLPPPEIKKLEPNSPRKFPIQQPP